MTATPPPPHPESLGLTKARVGGQALFNGAWHSRLNRVSVIKKKGRQDS